MAEPQPAPMSRRMPLWFLVPLLAAVLLAVVWGRVLWGGYRAYEQGMRHIENDETVAAVTYFDRSLHWYAPFNPWVNASAERLWEIGEEAESTGDTRLALIAYRTIRRGFYAARSVYQPGRDWIRRSEERIARLTREPDGSSMSVEGKGGSHPLPLQETRDPNVFWSIVVVVGLLGWIGFAVGFITAQWGPWRQGTSWFHRRWFLGGGFFLCLLLWFLGMMKA